MKSRSFPKVLLAIQCSDPDSICVGLGVTFLKLLICKVCNFVKILPKYDITTTCERLNLSHMHSIRVSC
ncbi:hypothetical protein GMA8713_02732 [Grimontia marina]|uniref:Uncharacterized protein n=1 Tax=Grimontia marina TaxID=646534 RepID=A0A128F9Z2_9GAMM|nr:hypothetical protein GMA8713_02732 [Grimontia marina]